MIQITRITVEALNNIIDIDIKGLKCFMPWETFVQETNCPFDVDNIISIAYEPDRNIYCVEKKGGIITGVNTSPEIVWIESNFDAITEFAEKYKPKEEVISPKIRTQEYLIVTDWLVTRHKEQLELGINTTLDANQYIELLEYRQYLRDYDDENSDINNVKPPPF